jgi:hypothetical protein
MPDLTKAAFLIAAVAFFVDVALLILAQSRRIGPSWPAAIGAVLVVLVLIAVAVVGRLNSHRELNDIARRVREEEEQRETD